MWPSVDRILVLLNAYSAFQNSVNPDFFQKYASSTYSEVLTFFEKKTKKSYHMTTDQQIVNKLKKEITSEVVVAL